MPYALTAKEKRTLESCEETIEKGLSSFIDVGRALMVIREEQLYKAEFKDFETYCRKRWNMGRSYANKLIASMEAATDVAEVETEMGTIVPKTEAEARELAKVESESERADVWVKAVETAPVDKQTGKPRITAAHVASTRKEMFGENGKPKKSVKKKATVKKPPKSKAKDDKEALRKTALSYLDYAQRAIDDAAAALKRDSKSAVAAVQKAMAIVKGWK